MTRGTVLVVDDAPGMVFFLREALTAAGYRVVAAVANDAVQMARDVHPDLVLLDIMMPGVDGPEVSRRLHADPHTASIPVIAISALPDLALKLHMLEMGADDYLIKPFGLDDLLHRIESWLPRPIPVSSPSHHVDSARSRLMAFP